MGVDTSSYDFMMQQMIVHILLFVFMSLHVGVLRTYDNGNGGVKKINTGNVFYHISCIWIVITLIRTGFGIVLCNNVNLVNSSGITLEKYISDITFKYAWAIIITMFIVTEMSLLQYSKTKENNDTTTKEENKSIEANIKSSDINVKKRELDLDTEARR